jgi:hypothetical protein
MTATLKCCPLIPPVDFLGVGIGSLSFLIQVVIYSVLHMTDDFSVCLYVRRL